MSRDSAWKNKDRVLPPPKKKKIHLYMYVGLSLCTREVFSFSPPLFMTTSVSIWYIYLQSRGCVFFVVLCCTQQSQVLFVYAVKLREPRPGLAESLTNPIWLLKVLDEPAAHQSDSTVLELQLRAISKKQHGDVAVRYVKCFNNPHNEEAHTRP